MRWLFAVPLTLACITASVHGDESLGLLLTDGRFATGTLDSATDDARLWLNTTEQRVVLRSSFPWSTVHTVVHDSKQLPVAEFRKIVGQLAGTSPPILVSTAVANASDVKPVDAVVRAEHLTGVDFQEPPIRSLRTRAWAASWDNDPELDGVLVEITPLGPSGEFVPVDGQLSMTLIGESSQGHPEHLRRFRQRYPEIARASIQVQADHFEGGHAVYKLPYQNLIPEDRLDVFPQGVVTATLGVPGQGNFAASTDALSLVPASPIRDRRQQLFGRRYFPQELSKLRNPSRFGDDRKTTGITLGYALP